MARKRSALAAGDVEGGCRQVVMSSPDWSLRCAPDVAAFHPLVSSTSQPFITTHCITLSLHVLCMKPAIVKVIDKVSIFLCLSSTKSYSQFSSCTAWFVQFQILLSFGGIKLKMSNMFENFKFWWNFKAMNACSALLYLEQLCNNFWAILRQLWDKFETTLGQF